MTTAQLISFDAERASKYLNGLFAGYLNDPADSDYQRGFLAAALVIYREGLGRGADDDRLTVLDDQVGSKNNFLHTITAGSLGMAEAGEQVRFLAANGYPTDREYACQHFTKGDVLTVADVSIGSFSSTYSFVGREGRFNTVCFEPVDPEQAA